MTIEIQTGLLRVGSGRTFFSDRQTFERFLSSIESTETGCWEWKKTKTRGDYGNISVNTPRGGEMLRAHIYAHAVVNREASPVVRHTCDNPCCVNPAHLLSGTNKDNSADMVAKGRSAKGHQTTSKDKRAIDESIVREIFKMKEAKYTGRAIASHLGLSPQTVSRVLLRHTWAWVDLS